MAAPRTFADLITSVQQLGLPDPDVGVTIGNFINEEYKIIAGERRWEWLQSTFTFSLTAGTFSYTISTVGPGNIRNFDALWLVDAAGNQFTIKWIEPLKLLDLNQDTPAATVGAPRYWSVWGGKILFYPNPDASYVTTVAYTKTLGAWPLNAPGDLVLFPGEYDTGLVWAAAGMMATRAHDWLSRDFMNQQRDRVWNNMRADYQLKQRQNTAEVEETGMWQSGNPQIGASFWGY